MGQKTEAVKVIDYLDAIPPQAVTRVAVFDPMQNPIAQLIDPSISLMNYMFVGEKYRAITRWLIGDVVAPEAVGFGFGNHFGSDHKLVAALASRVGWELVSPISGDI